MTIIDQRYLNRIKDALEQNDLEEAQSSFDQAQRYLFPFYQEELEMVVEQGGNLLLDAYLDKKDYLNAQTVWDIQCKKLVQKNTLREEIFYNNGHKILTAMNNDNTLSNDSYYRLNTIQRQLRAS
jgi:hypothetical protein